jgi:hypothetical protein
MIKALNEEAAKNLHKHLKRNIKDEFIVNYLLHFIRDVGSILNFLNFAKKKYMMSIDTQYSLFLSIILKFSNHYCIKDEKKFQNNLYIIRFLFYIRIQREKN